jgi:hypothetical protein
VRVPGWRDRALSEVDDITYQTYMARDKAASRDEAVQPSVALALA